MRSSTVRTQLLNTMISNLRTAFIKKPLSFRGLPALRQLSSESSRPEPQVASNLLQIGTRRIFEHEHDQYRELCRRFYEKKVVPFHKQWEEDGQVPRELWQEAGAEGLLCVTVPPEFGGMGLDVRYAAVHWEEQSYSNATGPGFAMHSDIVAPYIVHNGTQEQKERYLPDLCTGAKIGALAMTEPGVCSQFWFFCDLIVVQLFVVDVFHEVLYLK